MAPERAGVGTIATGSFLGWLTFFTTVIAAAWLAAKRTIRAFGRRACRVAVGCRLPTRFQCLGDQRLDWTARTSLSALTLTAWLMLVAAELNSDRNTAFPSTCCASPSISDDNWQSRCRQLRRDRGRHRRGPEFAHLSGCSNQSLVVHRTIAGDHRSRCNVELENTAATLHLCGGNSVQSCCFALVDLCFRAFPPVSPSSCWPIVIAGSLAGIVWLWLELRSRRLRQSENASESFLP